MQLGQSALKNPDVDEKNSQQKLPMRIVNVRVYARIVICLGMVLIGGTSGHAAESKHDRKQIEEATRLQIFLDNSNFSPGKIDGKGGEFTRKAITLFKRSQGHPDSEAQNSKTPIDTTGLDLASVDPVFTTYVVTKEDIESVGELPSGGTSQSEMATLSKCGGSSRREIPLRHRLSERAESYDNRKAQRRRPDHCAECEAIRTN